MLFNSWEFLVLLVITFAFYYASSIWSGRHAKAWQVSIALTASVIFYGWEDSRLISILAISCVGNSFAAAKIIKYKIADELSNVRKWTRIAVVANLSLLGIFKYLPFLLQIIPFIPRDLVALASSIPLPIGISFYTFHGISMIVDVARGEVAQESKGLIAGGRRFATGVRDIGFYLLFFPQLVAGPIVKAKMFWPQIGAKRIQDIEWRTVIRCLILGYFLKIFVADNLAEQTAVLTLGTEVLERNGPLNLIPLLYGYSFQIFADFAGYSLIAIGLAALFGYRFPQNFNFPYISTSITEFWRRWHMSLSSWLRDYLYVPLGGNRNGTVRTYVNLFLVMFFGGLWHGAAWKFALWGTLHGLILAAERFFTRRSSATPDPTGVLNGLRRTGMAFLTFHAVTILWLTFLMPDMNHIWAFFRGVFSGGKVMDGPPLFSLLFYGSSVVIYHLWGWMKEHRQAWADTLQRPLVEGILHGLMVFLIVTNPGAPRGFIYFQF